MAGKSIALDEGARKHLVEPKRGTAGYLLRNAKKYVLSEETLDAIEEQVRARSESPARSETP